MNHFNFKSLAFYGVAIGSVLLLFKVVTAYGENSLKAPVAINGSYRLTLSETLPNCEKSDFLILNIQQSGIYLNASLSSTDTNKDTNKALSLTGILKNQQLSLHGKVDKRIICHTPNSPNEPHKLVKMQMQLVDRGSMTGNLIIDGIPQTVRFTASPQNTQEQSQKLTDINQS